jgi:hypothetical protein
MRRYGVLMVLACSSLALLISNGAAQNQALSVGRVSYIEPDAKLGILRQGDARRLPTGFVEVIHDARLEACKRRNYQRCQPYEWSVPFAPQEQALKLERALSEAWNRYDARMYWRINTEINGAAAQYMNCTLAWFNTDSGLGAWDRDWWRQMPPKEFCDGMNADAVLYWAAPCSAINAATYWDRVGNAYQRAYQHALRYYYVDYWNDVLTAIAKYTPLALWWDGVYPVLPGGSSGLVLQAIMDRPNPEQYVQLALEASQTDPRGFAYMLARYPFLNLLGGNVVARLREGVRRWPLEASQYGEPGLAKLEGMKTKLAKREGIFSRSGQYLDVWNGPQPRDSSGATTPYEQAGVGHAVFIAAQSKFITEVSPRVPIFWRVCVSETIPPLPMPIPTPMPMVHANSRVETKWLSVPEGYRIPELKGFPAI